MAQFAFSGDPKAPGTDPATAEFGGIVFPLGKTVEVDEKENKDLVAQLRRHSHFTEGKAKNVPAVGLKAEHNGGGRFNITQGEVVLQTGLNKEDADAFNAMSPEDKAAYVAKKPE